MKWCSLLAAGTGSEGMVLGFGTARTDVTPVKKVTDLLLNLRNQVEEEGQAEAASYDKYACFCKAQADDKVYALKKADVEIEDFTAEIGALDGELGVIATDLPLLRGSVTTEEGAATTANGLRQTGLETYLNASANLTQGIEAIGGAIQSLKESRGQLSQVQVSAVLAQVEAVTELASVLESEQNPKAYVYQSKDILSTLQSLLATFKSKSAELNEDEADAAHSHNMLEGARANKVKALTASIDQKERLSAEKTAQRGVTQGLLDKETIARADDQNFLNELTAGCTQKATDWDQRSQSRASELTKLTEAMNALKQLGGMYSVNKKLTGFLKTQGNMHQAARPVSKKVTSFLQLSLAHDHVSQKLIAFLEQRAKALGSSSLEQLASVARLSDDPFVKVRGLINDLMDRLEAQATEEQTQKTFCDTQMGLSIGKRDTKQGEVERLGAEIEATGAGMAEHKRKIAELAVEIAALEKSKLELTTLRNQEKAENAKSVAEANEGKRLIDWAITALESFYTFAQVDSNPTIPAATTTSYAPFKANNSDRSGKTVADLAPETFSGNYDGKTGESAGVIGLLQVISSDFDRTATAVAAAETAADGAYTTQKGLIEGSITSKDGMKTSEDTALGLKVTALIGLKDSLKTEQGLHAAALTELEALKASCVDEAESYEQRRQRRKEEIEALKEAHRILEEWK